MKAPKGTLRGVGHTTPAPDQGKTTMNLVGRANPPLPAGVVNARLAAVREERKVTAQVIADLEKTSIDIVNQLIRVKNILNEVSIGMPAPEVREYIKEALDVIS